MTTLKHSQVVTALADLASSGRYSVDPQGARNMNALFEEVARVINELESIEATIFEASSEQEESNG